MAIPKILVRVAVLPHLAHWGWVGRVFDFGSEAGPDLKLSA